MPRWLARPFRWTEGRDRVLLAALAALAGLIALAAVAFASPTAVAAPPAATLAVLDLRGQALVLLDTATGGLRRIDLPGGPHEMVRLPDGRLVISLELAGRLAVVDPAAGSVETRDVGGLPHGLTLAGDVLSVTDESRDVLRRFELATPSPAGWLELAALPEGHWPHMDATLLDGEVAVANAADSTLRIGTHLVATSDTPEAIDVSPRSGDVATAGSYGGAVQVFDDAGALLWQSILGGRPVRVRYAPDGRSLAVSLSADHAVALIAPDGGTRLVPTGGAPDGLAFDPSGRFLYSGDLATGRVTLIDVAAGSVIAGYDVGQSAGALMLLGPATGAP
jgi:hypothetical protein